MCGKCPVARLDPGGCSCLYTGLSEGSSRKTVTNKCPLQGLQILDLTSGPAGGLATMILADFGARVVRCPDPLYEDLNDEPSARMWLRGKSIDEYQTNLLEQADVLIVSRPNGFDDTGFEHCARINPTLIHCEITASGGDSHLPPYEAVVAASAGRMQSLSGIIPGAGPHYSAVPVATHATAQNVVSGVLAALIARRQDGRGRSLSTSLLHGLMPYDMAQSLVLQVHPDAARPDPATLMPTLNYHPVQCADGKWLQLGNLLPHLFESFMRCIGLEDCLQRLPDGIEEVRDRILETMQTRPRDDWMAMFVEDGGIAAHPYLSAVEALNDPDMIMNGHVVTLNEVKQLGPLAKLTATPAQVTARAKEVTPQSTDHHRRRDDDSGSSINTHNNLPLAGVTVLELATIIAAPLGASFLADLGARVIKVEAIGGDPFRNMLGGLGAVRCNQGKESISVDLKTDQGRQIVQSLANRADVLIHNYRPGVPERLGIDYQTLAAINPRLVYVSANGYGSNGPGALRPSTHPIPGAAMGGAAYQAGGTIDHLLPIPQLREAARRLMRANEVNPDPNTAVVICTASLLGLLARETRRVGQQIFVDMFIANAYANFDDMVDYPGKPERPPLGPSLKGPHPLYRLYAASEGWVFLGLKTQREWRTFCSLVDWEMMPDTDPFMRPAAGLEAKLTELFSRQSAAAWESLFSTTGIGCVQADRRNLGEFFFEQCREGSELMQRVHHAELGDYYRHRPMIDFPQSQTTPRAGARAGVDGPALLRELDYSETTIHTLFDQGILWSAELR